MYNTVFITLGIGCNFQCRYCMQRDMMPEMNVNYMSNEVEQLLLKYAKERMAICGYTTHIQLWGGEPLLYWESFMDVVERLYPYELFTIGATSNGGLLTQDKVDFMNKYEVRFTLSHDGQFTENTRGRDMLKEQWFVDLYNKLDSKGVNGVLSAYNADLFSIKDYIYPILGTDISINLETLLSTWGMPEDITNIDLNVLDKALIKVVENAKNAIDADESNWESFYLMREINYFTHIAREENIEKQEFYIKYPRCRTCDALANIDLEGNFYACHNIDYKVGHFRDKKEDIIEEYQKFYTPKEKCLNCEYFLLCGGGCPIVKEEFFDRYCEVRKVIMKHVNNFLYFYKEQR